MTRRRPDGVWLVKLAALQDPGLLEQAVVSAVGIGPEPGEAGAPPSEPAGRLVEFARDKALLLVLDNCEHLAPGCAQLAGDVALRYRSWVAWADPNSTRSRYMARRRVSSV